jgi:CheY-like chemotaxis protein
MIENANILIVEDDTSIAELVALTLRKLNVVTHHRDNGQDALSFLDQFTPDLILLDISMPVMNGWQFLDLMQEDPAKRAIPVIVLTAHADSTNRMISQMERVSAFVTKPVVPNTLRSIVTDVLQSS